MIFWNKSLRFFDAKLATKSWNKQSMPAEVLKSSQRDGSRYQIGWIFGKVPKGGRGHFQYKKLCCRFWTNYIVFFGRSPKNLQCNFPKMRGGRRLFGIQFKSGSYDYSFKVQKTPKENVSNYTKSNLPIHLLKKRFQLILPVWSQKPPNFKVVIEW